ncbi:hypothetical protein WJU23_05380 [Prosthecobacter sp. SYSU 5D2]
MRHPLHRYSRKPPPPWREMLLAWGVVAAWLAIAVRLCWALWEWLTN